MSKPSRSSSRDKGTLYVVATPLGNLEDLSSRAVRVLAEVDLVACEDTRHTRKLLSHLSLKTPTLSYHEHNEEERAHQLVAHLREGKNVALVSDAGTPLLSDPGYRLVRMCRQEGLPVIPVPGPTAAVAALSVSGLPTDRFVFAGFPPRRAAARDEELKSLAVLPYTLVFYLSPHQLEAALGSLLQAMGNRQAFLIREMTKLHEEARFRPLAELLEEVSGKKPRGEYTLVVEGAAAALPAARQLDAQAYVAGLMQERGLPKREALKLAARDLGVSRRELYARLLDRRSGF